MIDKNGDNKVNVSEFKRWLRRNINARLNTRELNEVAKSFDTSRNGIISVNEFHAKVKALLKATNGDDFGGEDAFAK